MSMYIVQDIAYGAMVEWCHLHSTAVCTDTDHEEVSDDDLVSSDDG